MNQIIYNKEIGNSVIEFNLYDDGEFLVSITDDFKVSNGCDFLFSEKEFKELRDYFKSIDKTYSKSNID